MSRPSWSVTPKTNLGMWSVGLILAMPLLFFLGTSMTDTLYASVPAGGTLLKDIVARPALAITMLAGLACGVAAFITGLLAGLRQRERSPMVYVSIAVGALLIFFLAAEFIGSH